MRLEYQSNQPEWLVAKAREMMSRRVDLSNKYVHVTQLLQPAPQLAMTDHYWKELTQSLDDLLPAMLGVAWHKYLEGSMGYGAHEQRIEVPYNDWFLVGTPDWYNADRIIDFKTTRVWSAVFGDGGVKREWEEQLNVYRFLLYHAGHFDIQRLEVHAVYTDWSRNGAMRQEKHPRKRWEVLEVPVWHYDDTRNFIDARLKAIEEAKLTDVCTKEERWERDEKFAVMKKGRKSALKLFDIEADANTFALENDPSGKGINVYVEHRPGTPIRCLDWCPVREFCQFGSKLDEGN